MPILKKKKKRTLLCVYRHVYTKETHTSLGLGIGKTDSCPKRRGIVGNRKIATGFLSTLPVPEPWRNEVMEVATGVSSSGRSGKSIAEVAVAVRASGIRVATVSLQQLLYQTYLPILHFLRVTESMFIQGSASALWLLLLFLTASLTTIINFLNFSFKKKQTHKWVSPVIWWQSVKIYLTDICVLLLYCTHLSWQNTIQRKNDVVQLQVTSEKWRRWETEWPDQEPPFMESSCFHILSRLGLAPAHLFLPWARPCAQVLWHSDRAIHGQGDHAATCTPTCSYNHSHSHSILWVMVSLFYYALYNE